MDLVTFVHSMTIVSTMRAYKALLLVVISYIDQGLSIVLCSHLKHINILNWIDVALTVVLIKQVINFTNIGIILLHDNLTSSI